MTRHFRRADIVPMALFVPNGPFTLDSYQRLGELGLLGEEERVELIDGQVVAMTPIGDRHASCVRRLNRLFSRSLLEVAIIDVQNSLVLGERDAPQPDVTLLKPRADGYAHHPRPPDTLLVIEVADATLAFDRNIKIPRYALADIPEVWLVDLAADRIELFREPAGGEYRERRTVSRGEEVIPLLVPQVSFAVSEILG